MNLFKPSWKIEQEADNLRNATIRIIVDKVKAKVAEYNKAIKDSKEWKEFDTTFQNSDPTVALYQVHIDKLNKANADLQKTFETETTSSMRRAISELRDSINYLNSGIQELTDKARDKEFTFLSVPNGLKGRIEDLLLVAPSKEAAKQIEFIMNQFDDLVKIERKSSNSDYYTWSPVELYW